MPAVTVRYFAGARAAAGLDSEDVSAGSLGDLVAHLAEQHGPRLATVLSACSYLLDGVAVHEPATPLPDGATVDVLPPFAGG